MKSEQLNKQFELLSGSFSPSEVGDMIVTSIDNQINSYKLKNLSNWIHDHNCNQDVYESKIIELQSRKKELQMLISKAQKGGHNLWLSEKLDVKLDQHKYNFSMS